MHSLKIKRLNLNLKLSRKYYQIERDDIIDSFIEKLLYQVEIMSLNIKIMKMNKLILLCVFSIIAYSCSDDDENPAIEAPNIEAEVQIKEVLDILKKDDELSMFCEALTDIDAKKFADKEFTILAYKNQNTPKTRSLKADSVEQLETMRHIIGGRHTFEELSKLSKIVALSKDTLYIKYSETDKSITVNGILLGKSITADKSIVFVTDDIIPKVQDTTHVEEKEFLFKVMDINPNWRNSNDSEGSRLTENALITIYENDKIITELRTDKDGVARFLYKGNNNLDYAVKTDTSNMIYQDYLVAGLFTSQEQISKSPVQEGKFKAIPGGLRFVDINGDGLINEKDKVDRRRLINLSDNMIVYLVGKSYTFPQKETEVTIDMAYDAYDEAEAIFMQVDSVYSTLTSRQKLSASSKILDDVWNSAYDAIIKINAVMDYSSTDAEDRLELKGFRTNLHFYLSLLFGDIPLQLTHRTNNIARSSQQEVYDFLTTSYNDILSKSSNTRKYEYDNYINSILVCRLQKKYTEMYQLAKKGVDSGTITLRDNRSELNAIRIYLLLAEAANELGKHSEAIQNMNILLSAEAKPNLGMDVSTDKLRTFIRSFYHEKNYEGTSYDYGIKYNNIVSWSLNSTWGIYTLLPIPSKALTAFGKETLLTQNPGY